MTDYSRSLLTGLEPCEFRGSKARFPLSPYPRPPEPPTQFCQPLPSQSLFPHLLLFPDCVPLWCECPSRKHGEEKVFVAPVYVTILQNTSSVSWDYRSHGPFFQNIYSSFLALQGLTSVSEEMIREQVEHMPLHGHS